MALLNLYRLLIVDTNVYIVPSIRCLEHTVCLESLVQKLTIKAIWTLKMASQRHLINIAVFPIVIECVTRWSCFKKRSGCFVWRRFCKLARWLVEKRESVPCFSWKCVSDWLTPPALKETRLWLAQSSSSWRECNGKQSRHFPGWYCTIGAPTEACRLHSGLCSFDSDL